MPSTIRPGPALTIVAISASAWVLRQPVRTATDAIDLLSRPSGTSANTASAEAFRGAGRGNVAVATFCGFRLSTTTFVSFWLHPILAGVPLVSATSTSFLPGVDSISVRQRIESEQLPAHSIPARLAIVPNVSPV